MRLSYVIAIIAAGGAMPLAAQTKPTPERRPVSPAQPVPRSTFLATMDGEFRKLDADKNNIVTRAEIDQHERAALADRIAARNRALFAQLDADKNGQISPQEFLRIQLPATAPDPGRVLAQNDLNKDGAISLVEWRTAKLANFDRLDADKDGIVSVPELKAGGIVK